MQGVIRYLHVDYSKYCQLSNGCARKLFIFARTRSYLLLYQRTSVLTSALGNKNDSPKWTQQESKSFGFI